MHPVKNSHRLPALFLGHGSPMLALEHGPWHEALGRWAWEHPAPEAALVISAHWESGPAFRITSAPRPGVMHDFSGFAQELYRLDYPAPGAPALAEEVAARLRAAGLDAEQEAQRPLDHGAWVPLRALYPAADVPVLQLSLPVPRTPRQLLKAGTALAPLREQGVLILGSGGLVHNLRRLHWDGHPPPEAWASEFEAWVLERIWAGDVDSLEDASSRAPHYALAVPTPEHFAPLFAVLGASGRDHPSTLFEGWQHGNLSLRAVQFG